VTGPAVFERILVPTDFSVPSERAWRAARRLARAVGAEVVLLHVLVDTPLYSETVMSAEQVRGAYAATRGWAERKLGEWADEARAEGLGVRTAFRTGVAHEEIVAAARETRAGLIAIGTHGRSGLDRVLLGSVADRVIRLAPCPVLAIREPE
jgi:nucleotide-binding universal stress UspA family protein